MKIEVTNGFAVVMFALAMAGIIALFTSALAGCADWQKKSCAAIDVAHQACAFVKYVDEDGQERQVSVTNEDAKQLGKAKASRDAGAPAR